MVTFNEQEEGDEFRRTLLERISKYPPKVQLAFFEVIGLDHDDSTPRPIRPIRESLAKYPPEIQLA